MPSKRALHAVRLPAVAGTFYPDDPELLLHTLKTFYRDADNHAIDGRIIALVVPHAGYQYSGLTAANGYKLLTSDRFETVVVVSPSHREYFHGISVCDGSAYRTPLGDLLIDDSRRDALVANDSLIERSAQGHRAEHALEVQLPFLQTTVGSFKLLPIVMGDQRREFCFHLGEKLAAILFGRDDVLLVASSDLSHYYPSAIARTLDRVFIEDVAALDPSRLMNDLETDRTEACGGGPTVAVLDASQRLGANRVTMLHQCNSGDITGDHSSVVGYCSAVIYQSPIH